jgi:uncharacterized protein (DUF302 family)
MNPARRRRSDQQHLRSGSNPKQPETSDSLGMNPVGPRLADLDTFDTRITVGVRNREERPLRRAHDEQRRAMSDLLITQSTDSYQQTVARLERELANRGLDVFARVDHAANARTVGLRMPATLVITSGSRLAATPLMVETPDLALDLPLRVLIRQTDHGVELVSTNPAALLERHGLPPASAAPLNGITAIISAAAGVRP